MRKRAKLDANQSDIVRALRQAGATVQSLATIGNGCPDLLVSACGNMWLFEIKDSNQPPSKQALTPDEKQWHESWQAKVHIVTSVEDALDLIGEL